MPPPSRPQEGIGPKPGGAAGPDGPSLYRMFVRDLTLPCRIGVYLHEKTAPQRVRINVDLAMSAAGAQADDMTGLLSYEDVVHGVKGLIAKGHVNLVETLAERIADLCLFDGRVRSVRVRVEKLEVFEEAASVGVEIERHADAAPARNP